MSRDTERRPQRQWLLSALVLAGLLGVVGLVLDLMLDLDWAPWTALVVGLAAVPVAVAAGRSARSRTVAPAVLTGLLVVGAMVVASLGFYVLVIMGLHGPLEGSERTIVALSMGATAVVVLAAPWARRRVTDWANRRVYGELRSPEEALRTFGGRMSRAVPIDELLLQLVETLKKTMELTQAEVWTGSDGVLSLAASVPDQVREPLRLTDKELTVAARAHAQGNSWLEVWIPQLAAGREDQQLRAVSVAHLGELLGFIVLTRPGTASAFSEDEDAALVELALQLGLALHNVRLDSALQASLDELAARNRELVASRARIVAAADESRRMIERDLHDGAQQHLVALAVKTGLIKTLMGSDSGQAEALVDEVHGDIQATLTELRELAHGIYPPLLMERGLTEALRTVANRAVLATDVEATGVGRYPRDLEAAVYFCCVEAVQNAGKYAGEQARVTIWVGDDGCSLSFRVSDDGSGFDPELARDGHGFVNMADRLGAFGGSLSVESEPGCGAVVAGSIPLSESAGRTAEV